MPVEENATVHSDSARAARVSRLAGAGDDAPAANATETPVEETAAKEETTSTETAPDPEAAVRAERHRLLKEKAEKLREERKAARLAEQAQRLKDEAEVERKSLAEERERLNAGKKDYRKLFTELGLDAEQAYRELFREMTEAGTPEGQIRKMQEAFASQQEAIKKELEAKVTPLQEEVDRLRAEKVEQQAHLHEQQLFHAYGAAAKDAAFFELRAEYGDRDIFETIREWDSNPQSFYEHAKTYGVALSKPGHGFSMREAFSVIKAVYDQDRAAKEQRRARLLPPTESPAGQEQPAQRTPTVNGTTEPTRNAGTTITNDLASSRASSGRRLTRKERVDAIIRREEKR